MLGWDFEGSEGTKYSFSFIAPQGRMPARMPQRPITASHHLGARETPPPIAAESADTPSIEGECAVEQNERQDRNARPREGEDAEHNGGDTSDQEEPPIAREPMEQGVNSRPPGVRHERPPC
jgi:hypothetical protein